MVGSRLLPILEQKRNSQLVRDNPHLAVHGSKDATGGPRNYKYPDDVLYPHFSVNLALGVILGIIFLNATHIPHHGLNNTENTRQKTDAFRGFRTVTDTSLEAHQFSFIIFSTV
ncbi:hypothetical protein PUN28_000596 [Cardiocondyla obscurior]|uniref:Uncharacterized protein n=1 Tax=Cardiocondyla obscurior TaxID=286306 RepID=A0AAW2H079_9HYME